MCNTRVVRFEGEGRVERVVCAVGSIYEADLLLVGVEAVANMQLAVEAGLTCDNGVVVEEHCRTSDPSVYAAGDCMNHPTPRFGMRVHLESVDNAVEQAKAASLNMVCKPTIHDRVPWFWSDECENELLIVGLSQGHDQQVTRCDPALRSFSVCYLKGGELLALEAINHSKDYMAARKLIVEGAADLGKLGDPQTPLHDTVEETWSN